MVRYMLMHLHTANLVMFWFEDQVLIRALIAGIDATCIEWFVLKTHFFTELQCNLEIDLKLKWVLNTEAFIAHHGDYKWQSEGE